MLKSLNKIYSGKVRDLYAIDDAHMLMVASDRISAFDVIFNELVPHKGEYLTQISNFWFAKMHGIIENHLTNISLADYLTPEELAIYGKRALIVKKLTPVKIEAVVRGYLCGSGYKDYLKTGTISGHALPSGLKNADKLPEVIFTPSTKAQVGDHDENISVAQCIDLIGADLTKQIQETAIKIYTQANEIARDKGLIIADTKFEFGLDENGKLFLMDELLTPDSSRFWAMATYAPGENPPSFDKQFLRDYLEKTINWNKQPPIPILPVEVLAKTAQIYKELVDMFVGDK